MASLKATSASLRQLAPLWSNSHRTTIRRIPDRPISRFANPRPRAPRPLKCPHQQHRHAATFLGNARKLFHQSPFQMTLATAAIVAGIGFLGFANWMYRTYIIGAFHKYPEEVAKPLRKALWYTNEDFQPKEALKFYKQALRTAEELQMDPVGDEFVGIKLQVAHLMERAHQYYKVIEVLERIRADNLEWLKRFGGLEHNKKRRTHVLLKTIQITIKLGGVYASPAVWDREAAQKHLLWAVETSLKEKQRRDAEHVRDEDEGEWMSNDQMGASLEALAHSYESNDQHYLSTPLFLHALRLYPTNDCHAVVLMNNIASSLSQQSPENTAAVQAYAESFDLNQRPVGPRATRETFVANAQEWAQKALDVASTIKPPQRTEECDMGCAVALHNLGEFAEMRKDIVAARKSYAEAASLANAIGFQEGVEQSSTRLKALEGAVG